MRVCRCNHTFSQFIRKRHNLFVDCAQIIISFDPLAIIIKLLLQHEAVIDNRLDFQIIVTGSNLFLFFL